MRVLTNHLAAFVLGAMASVSSSPGTDITASVLSLDSASRAKLEISLWDLSVLLVNAGSNHYYPLDSAKKSGVYAAAQRLVAKGYATITTTSGKEAYLSFAPTSLGQAVLDAARQQPLVVPIETH
jgi:hypothetical protein